MNARHDSHDFFQRFVPQGECVSVLFLQFRRQIYLHIIPFGQKRANLIQRPVFKYNLIACPRDSQLDISFFYLKPSVTLVESTDFSRMQKTGFRFRLQRHRTFFQADKCIFRTGKGFYIEFCTVYGDFHSFGFNDERMILIVGHIKVSLSIQPDISVFRIIIRIISKRSSRMNPYIRPVRQSYF